MSKVDEFCKEVKGLVEEGVYNINLSKPPVPMNEEELAEGFLALLHGKEVELPDPF